MMDLGAGTCMSIDSIVCCDHVCVTNSALRLSNKPSRHRICTITEALRRTTTSSAHTTSTAKFVMSTALRIKSLSHSSVFYIMLVWCKLPEDGLKKIETYRSLRELHVEVYILVLVRLSVLFMKYLTRFICVHLAETPSLMLDMHRKQTTLLEFARFTNLLLSLFVSWGT